jgi:hypothetical protein
MVIRQTFLFLLALLLSGCQGGCTTTTTTTHKLTDQDGSSTEVQIESVSKDGVTVERKTETTIDKNGNQKVVVSEKRGGAWAPVK